MRSGKDIRSDWRNIVKSVFSAWDCSWPVFSSGLLTENQVHARDWHSCRMRDLEAHLQLIDGQSDFHKIVI